MDFTVVTAEQGLFIENSIQVIGFNATNQDVQQSLCIIFEDLKHFYAMYKALQFVKPAGTTPTSATPEPSPKSPMFASIMPTSTDLSSKSAFQSVASGNRQLGRQNSRFFGKPEKPYICLHPVKEWTKDQLIDAMLHVMNGVEVGGNIAQAIVLVQKEGSATMEQVVKQTTLNANSFLCNQDKFDGFCRTYGMKREMIDNFVSCLMPINVPFEGMFLDLQQFAT